MPIRHAKAKWEGNLTEGKGSMALGSGAFEAPFSFGTRLKEEKGTNPEELLGAAHAGCFSMALSSALTKAGHPPRSIDTKADVHLDKVGDKLRITLIRLSTDATVPGIDEETFRKLAEDTKVNCPVSQALSATTIELAAKLTT